MSETPHDDEHIPDAAAPQDHSAPQDHAGAYDASDSNPSGATPAGETPASETPTPATNASDAAPAPSAPVPPTPPVTPAAAPTAAAAPAAPIPPAPRYGEYAPPTAPTQPLGSSQYPAQAPQYPAPTPQQHQQPAPGQYPVGSSFGPAAVPPHADATAGGPGGPHANAPRSTSRRRTATVGIVAALAVGAVIGGAAGAGVAVVAGNSNHATASSATVNPTTITVNDPGNATTITAVAAKAAASVVTIDVSDSSEAGTGSGVILDTSGDILTNTHVVTLDGASSTGTIKVTLNDGRIFSGTVVGTDPVSDLAVVKISGATGLQPATFGDSTKLNVGDTAVAIGAPLGLSGTVTEGIVSALNRSITIASSAVPDSSGSDQSQDNSQTSPFNFNFGQGNGSTSTQSTGTIALSVIQTDAAINPGNSGGALLDSDGQVIGINVAIASASDTSSTSGQSGSIGVGFAIPAVLAQRIASEIMSTGSGTHGMLGASVQDTTTNSDVAGATVASVQSGSAADKAGIKSGDVITKFNGLPITDSTDLIAEVRAAAAGAKVTLTYVRGGSAYDVDVTLGTYTS